MTVAAEIRFPGIRAMERYIRISVNLVITHAERMPHPENGVRLSERDDFFREIILFSGRGSFFPAGPAGFIVLAVRIIVAIL